MDIMQLYLLMEQLELERLIRNILKFNPNFENVEC